MIGGRIFSIDRLGRTSSKDHRPEAAVANGQRIHPLGSGAGIPELEIAAWMGCCLGIGQSLGLSRTLGQQQISSNGGGGGHKAAAREATHESYPFASTIRLLN